MPQVRQVLSRKPSPLGELFDTARLLQHYELFRAGGMNTLTHFDWFKLLGTSIWLEHLQSSTEEDEPLVANRCGVQLYRDTGHPVRT